MAAAVASGRGDRLSSLPDHIIQHIFSFIPSTKCLARTSVLSKRWRSLWTHHPNIHLYRSHRLDLDHCLRSCKARSLNRLFIQLWLPPPHPDEYQATFEALDRWLRFAALCSVRTLEIRIMPCTARRPTNSMIMPCTPTNRRPGKPFTWRDFKLPASIFSCLPSLSQLVLDHCTFPPLVVDDQGSEALPAANLNLKTLRLSYIGMSDAALAHLISASPILETLHLNNVHGVARPVLIPNLPMLAHLRIALDCTTSAVTILAPSITTVEYVGRLGRLNWTASSSALTKACLFCPVGHPETLDDWSKLVRVVADATSLEASPWLFNFSIPKGGLIFSDGRPTFKNLRRLCCAARWVTCSFLCSFASGLRECPLLEELSVNLIAPTEMLPLFLPRETDVNSFLRRLEDEHEGGGSGDPSEYLGGLDYSLCHLKTIAVKRFLGTRNAIQLVGFLLGKAILLEELVLYCAFTRNEWECAEASATIPQVSSKVRMLFKGDYPEKIRSY